MLGDRSVLYKYANPNLVAVVALGGTHAITTVTPDGGKKSTAAGNGLMTIFMMDAINGQIVFSAQHQRAAGPVHLVHCENWVVVWNRS